MNLLLIPYSLPVGHVCPRPVPRGHAGTAGQRNPVPVPAPWQNTREQCELAVDDDEQELVGGQSGFIKVCVF